EYWNAVTIKALSKRTTPQKIHTVITNYWTTPAAVVQPEEKAAMPEWGKVCPFRVTPIGDKEIPVEDLIAVDFGPEYMNLFFIEKNALEYIKNSEKAYRINTSCDAPPYITSVEPSNPDTQPTKTDFAVIIDESRIYAVNRQQIDGTKEESKHPIIYVSRQQMDGTKNGGVCGPIIVYLDEETQMLSVNGGWGRSESGYINPDKGALLLKTAAFRTDEFAERASRLLQDHYLYYPNVFNPSVEKAIKSIPENEDKESKIKRIIEIKENLLNRWLTTEETKAAMPSEVGGVERASLLQEMGKPEVMDDIMGIKGLPNTPEEVVGILEELFRGEETTTTSSNLSKINSDMELLMVLKKHGIIDVIEIVYTSDGEKIELKKLEALIDEGSRINPKVAVTVKFNNKLKKTAAMPIEKPVDVGLPLDGGVDQVSGFTYADAYRWFMKSYNYNNINQVQILEALNKLAALGLLTKEDNGGHQKIYKLPEDYMEQLKKATNYLMEPLEKEVLTIIIQQSKKIMPPGFLDGNEWAVMRGVNGWRM
ncbi:MAG: hypothetical protein JW778_05530, partial [Candidatus Altiarchaeota archaeon]|nr:hypothetical protein [Candidatus Altiarchaeota archaeon]